MRYVDLQRMDHPVAEAAIADDDPEGFWHQGRDLDDAEVYALNERIVRERVWIILKGTSRWLITFGRGQVFLVEPVTTCSECGQTLWIDEVHDYRQPVHSTCRYND